MTTFLCKLLITEGKEAEYEKVQRKLYEETHANEQGCVRYEFYRATADRTYYALLSFSDYKAFFIHQVADYHVDANLDPLLEAVEIIWLDPMDGGNKLVGTNPEPVTDDMGTPAELSTWRKLYEGNFNLSIPEWWKRLRQA